MKENSVSVRSITSSHVLSSTTLMSTVEKVKQQIEYGEFYNEKLKCVPPQVGEICLIIAEVLMLNPYADINIESQPMKAEIVQEIFISLEHDHIQFVIDNFKTVTKKIPKKKSYIRTMLYNSIFEIDSHYQNQVAHDLWN